MGLKYYDRQAAGFLRVYYFIEPLGTFFIGKMGTGYFFDFKKVPAWVQVSNATLNFGIIYQKKGVAYVPLLSVKY